MVPGQLALDCIRTHFDLALDARLPLLPLAIDLRPALIESIGDTCGLAGNRFRFRFIVRGRFGFGDKRTGFAFLTPPLIGKTPDQIARILVMRFAVGEERSRSLADRQRRRFQIGIVASDQRAQCLEVPRDPDPADRRQATRVPVAASHPHHMLRVASLDTGGLQERPPLPALRFLASLAQPGARAQVGPVRRLGRPLEGFDLGPDVGREARQEVAFEYDHDAPPVKGFRVPRRPAGSHTGRAPPDCVHLHAGGMPIPSDTDPAIKSTPKRTPLSSIA